MNLRQKKKRYKKLYGHNPPKGPDGRYMFHIHYGIDPASVQALREASIKSAEDLENNLESASAHAAKVMHELAAAVNRTITARFWRNASRKGEENEREKSG